MARERERLRRIAKKVINLKNEMVTQKAEIKISRSRRRENTPATGITAGLNTLVTRKKKNLEHPKRLSNGKDPSYEFWQRAIRHKIIINEHKTPTAAEQVNYIINRYKRKAVAHLKANLRKGTFDGNPEHLMNFLKNLFNNPHRQDKALQQFQRLFIKPGDKYGDFYLKFRKLAANTEFPKSLLKSKLNQKITPELQFGAVAKITRPESIF